MMHKDGTLYKSQTGASTSLWEKLSIIPYIEGQKYTVGQLYKSREIQGEFIIWDMQKLHHGEIYRGSGTESDLFVIVCDDGKYWVTPNLRGIAVYKNSTQLKDRTRLKFGDKIFIGGIPTEQIDACLGIIKFQERVFKERGRNWMMEKQENKAQVKGKEFREGFILGKIELIVSNILSYLEFDDMLQTRFVSKLWNRESVKILQKRCIVIFGLHNHYWHSNQLFRHHSEMKNSSHPWVNWKIIIPPLEHEKATQTKLIDDLNWFIKQTDYPLKEIRLHVQNCSMLGFEMVMKILHKFAKSLHTLHISGDLRIQEVMQLFPKQLLLNKLQNFEFYLEGSYDDSVLTEITDLPNWVEWWIQVTKKVRALEFNFPPRISTLLIPRLSRTGFANLAEICMPKIHLEELKAFAEVEQSFKKLQFNWLWNSYQDWGQEEVTGLEELLAKHSQTLTSLILTLPPSRLHGLNVQFPVMPVLQLLEINWFNNAVSVYLPAEDEGRSNKFPIRIATSSADGVVNYDKDFPCLLQLFMCAMDGDSNDCVADEETIEYYSSTFFRTDDEGQMKQICRSLTLLDIPKCLLSPSVERIFPSAVFIKNDI